MDVQVEFCPKLKDGTIEVEAKRLAEEKAQEEEKERQQAADEESKTEAASPVPSGVSLDPHALLAGISPLSHTCTQKKKGRKSASGEGEKTTKPGLPSNSKASLASSSKALQPTTVQTPAVNSDLWWQAYHNLLGMFDSQRLQLSIPCFVSQSVAMATDAQTTPTYR